MAETWDFPNPNGDGFGFWLENLSVSGGVALNGEEQNVFGENMRWRARGGFSFRTKDQILRGRALFDKLQGRAGTILVPTFDGKRVSWPVQEIAAGSTGVILHPGVTRDRSLDGTAYADPEVPAASEVSATVQSDIALRATTGAINVSQGGPLLPGQYFGIGNFLYRIKGVTGPVGNVYGVSFLPPAREAHVATTVVKITRPVCEMRQASDDQGMKELQSMRFSDLTLEFVENF